MNGKEFCKSWLRQCFSYLRLLSLNLDGASCLKAFWFAVARCLLSSSSLSLFLHHSILFHGKKSFFAAVLLALRFSCQNFHKLCCLSFELKSLTFFLKRFEVVLCILHGVNLIFFHTKTPSFSKRNKPKIAALSYTLHTNSYTQYRSIFCVLFLSLSFSRVQVSHGVSYNVHLRFWRCFRVLLLRLKNKSAK